MGDRGNVAVTVEANKPPIYFYTHWGGSNILDHVQDALDIGRSRWNDPPYLARIIFCSMMRGADLTGTTGFGISHEVCDNEHPIVEVDIPNRVVRQEHRKWTFEALVEADLGR